MDEFMSYCGYCGEEYIGDYEQICDNCYNDDDVRDLWIEEAEWDMAERENDRELEYEATRWYV